MGSLLWLWLSILLLPLQTIGEVSPYNIKLGFKEVGLNRFMLLPCVSNNSDTPANLDYTVALEKGDKAVTRQKGNLFIRPKAKRCDFSRVIVTIKHGETLRARFYLYKDGRLLAETTLFYPEAIS